MLVIGQYCLSVSLFSAAAEDKFIDQHVVEDKHNQDGEGISRQRQKGELQDKMEKFLPVKGFLSLMDHMQNINI